MQTNIKVQYNKYLRYCRVHIFHMRIKHFLELRTTSHAQTEIRYIANDLRTKLINYMPFIWSDIGDKVEYRIQIIQTL